MTNFFKFLYNIYHRALATIIKKRKMSRDVDSIRMKNEEFFNNNLTLLSTGALVISIGFIEKIFPIQTSIYVWMIYLSWVLFLLSLIINLYSYIYGSNFGRKLNKYVYDNTKNDMTQNELDTLSQYQYIKILRYNKANNFINHFVYSFFIIGVIFICIFAFLNFNNIKAMDNKKTQDNLILNEGFSYSLPEKSTKTITIEKNENTIVTVTDDSIQITIKETNK